MVWLKRNLMLVVGGLVALGLLGLAGYYLYTKIQFNQQVTDELNNTTETLKRLVNRNPHPGTDEVDNISAAQEEAKKLQGFVENVRGFFPYAYSATNQPTSRDFRSLLDTSINELRRNAEFAGVEVPKDYWFTFSPQKSTMTFASQNLGPLTAQLLEIKSLCNIVFDAKPISLVGLKRVAVAEDDVGPQDFLTIKATTNEYAIVTPYEVTFNGFSEQLADVLEELIKSTNCFVVRNITTYPEDSAPPPDSTFPSPYGMNPYMSRGMAEGGSPYGSRYGMPGASPYGMGRMPGMGMDPSLASRYGIAPPQPAYVPPTTRSSSTSMLLQEKILRMTLEVDSIKLKPAQ